MKLCEIILQFINTVFTMVSAVATIRNYSEKLGFANS
nr:MAG TPA: hypothetical protein [Bacteriophage sp.]